MTLTWLYTFEGYCLYCIRYEHYREGKVHTEEAKSALIYQTETWRTIESSVDRLEVYEMNILQYAGSVTGKIKSIMFTL